MLGILTVTPSAILAQRLQRHVTLLVGILLRTEIVRPDRGAHASVFPDQATE